MEREGVGEGGNEREGEMGWGDELPSASRKFFPQKKSKQKWRTTECGVASASFTQRVKTGLGGEKEAGERGKRDTEGSLTGGSREEAFFRIKKGEIPGEAVCVPTAGRAGERKDCSGRGL